MKPRTILGALALLLPACANLAPTAPEPLQGHITLNLPEQARALAPDYQRVIARTIYACQSATDDEPATFVWLGLVAPNGAVTASTVLLAGQSSPSRLARCTLEKLKRSTLPATVAVLPASFSWNP
jgi:hypothetical protein